MKGKKRGVNMFDCNRDYCEQLHDMKELLKEAINLLNNSDELYAYQVREFYLKCEPFIKEE